jgi:DNA mismatch repair protein MutS
LPKIKNYSIAVKEYNDQILFLRKIIPGPSDKSYGIQVAKLAGLPEKLISRSKEILSQLEQPKLNNQKTNENNLQLQLNQTKTIEKEKINELIEKLKSIDINSITPIEAFNLLLNIINNINKTNK